MGQINISYDDGLIVNLDKVAAARNVTRPELLRAIAAEAIEAHDAGRLAFDAPRGPQLDTSLNALAAQLKETVVELDRSQRHNQRREKKLRDAWVASEDTILAAQAELTRRVNDTNRESYQPFVQKQGQLLEAMAGVAPRVSEAVTDSLSTIEQRLMAIQDLASEPREHYQLVLGENQVWTLRFIVAMAAAWSIASVLLFLAFAGLVQPVAVSVANRLLDDQASLCRVVEKRYGTFACEVPIEDRVRYARVRKLEARR